jgi:hypothetical protein
MADGSTVPISEVEMGALVAARDPETGEVTAQPVLKVIVGYGDKHLIKVVTAPAVDNASDNGQIAEDDPSVDAWTATANHPIWVKDQGWTNADGLAVGDLLEGAAGAVRIVQDVDDEGWFHDQAVYNLSIANTHTYIVGGVGGGTTVHNASSPVCLLAPGPHAGASVPATGRRATEAEKRAVDKIGQRTGCHSCGAKTSNGRYTPDHQPPTAMANGRPQQLYPHCSSCSRSQGGYVAANIRRNGRG